jgi:hypothetical protein
MHRFIIIIFFLVSNFSLGQTNTDQVESIISDFQAELASQNISDFFALKQLAPGSIHIFKYYDPNICGANGIYFELYLFWKNGNDSYIKKYDNCGGFEPLPLSDSEPINFFEKNAKNLKVAEVRPYQTKPDSIGVNGIVYKSISSVSHSSQRVFWFFSRSSQFKKRFIEYDLTSEVDQPNLHYKTNNELSIVQLNIICEEIIGEFESKNSFKRTK